MATADVHRGDATVENSARCATLSDTISRWKAMVDAYTTTAGWNGFAEATAFNVPDLGRTLED